LSLFFLLYLTRRKFSQNEDIYKEKIIEMKKLYFLNEEEKERILNMHKDATKKQYLIENKNIINEDIELINEQRAKKIKDAFIKWIYNPLLKPTGKAIKKGGNILIGNRKQILQQGIEKLKKSGILDSDGNIYAVEIIPGKKSGEYTLSITKKNLEYTWENNYDEFLEKDFLDSGDILTLNNELSGQKLIPYEELDKLYKVSMGNKLQINVVNNKVKDIQGNSVPVPHFQELELRAKTKNIRKKLQSAKNVTKATRATLASLSILLTVYAGWAGVILRFLGLETRNALEKNARTLANIPELSTDELIYEICNLPQNYQSSVVMSIANPQKGYNDLIKLVNSKNYDAAGKRIQSMDIDVLISTIENYSKDNQKYCLFNKLKDLSKGNEQDFEKHIVGSLKNLIGKTEKRNLQNLTNNQFFNTIGQSVITDSNFEKNEGQKLESFAGFDLSEFKKQFANCRCKLYDYLYEYETSGNQNLKLFLLQGKKNKIYPLIINQKEQKVLSSFCAEADYDELNDILEQFKKIDELTEEEAQEVKKTSETFLEKITRQTPDKC